MRTQKGFTPTTLDRFMREGRGQGVYDDFKPWHKVSRGDPASSGRSHLLMFRGRLRELLSDGEFRAHAFVLMLPYLDDVLEQVPLDHGSSLHPICSYLAGGDPTYYPGTVAVSDELGFRHPICTGKSSKRQDHTRSVLWTMSTDLLVVTRSPTGIRDFLAVSVKPSADPLRDRQIELMMIEREYWASRSIPWVLITKHQYSKAVGLTLTRSSCWALQQPVLPAHKAAAVGIARARPSDSLTSVLRHVEKVVGSLEVAQNALWQSIWTGALPVDLNMGWRPHLPLLHIQKAAFWEQNPIAVRRSAWN